MGNLVETEIDRTLLAKATPLVQERMQLLGEAPTLLSFLFTPDAAIEFDADALPGADAIPILDAAIDVLGGLEEWTTPVIEETLRITLIEGLELKPRLAFGALRTGISGKRISPPLFESMELLGQESTLARLARLRAAL
jgi:glutamyl-tRNA synthetase